jgi:hypothetical protein
MTLRVGRNVCHHDDSAIRIVAPSLEILCGVASVAIKGPNLMF